MKVKTEGMELFCDCCGEMFENADGFVSYADDPDGSLIWSDAESSDWINIGDKHFCPDCWSCDDDDNTIIKDGRRFDANGNPLPLFKADRNNEKTNQ